jgi:phosphatidylglycerophosphatase C
MPNLALFDFDGTITVKDTFTPFVRYALDPVRMKYVKVLPAPIILSYLTNRFRHSNFTFGI